MCITVNPAIFDTAAEISTAEELSECTIRKATEGASEGGALDPVVNNAGLEDLLPDVPAAVAAAIEKAAPLLQIAKNKVRKKATWLVIIVLATAFDSNGHFRWSYNVPATPTGVKETPTPTSTSESCNPAAPTGSNAVFTPPFTISVRS